MDVPPTEKSQVSSKASQKLNEKKKVEEKLDAEDNENKEDNMKQQQEEDKQKQQAISKKNQELINRHNHTNTATELVEKDLKKKSSTDEQDEENIDPSS